VAAVDAAQFGPAAFLWVMVENGVAGFLDGLSTRTTTQQIALLLNLARLLLKPSAAFAAGLLKGVVEGVWDGVVGLFGLVGSAVTLVKDLTGVLAVLARQVSDPTVVAHVRADIATLQAELAPLMGELSTPQGRGRVLRDARQVAGLVQGLVAEKVAAIARDMGRSVALALLGAITGSDEHIGEGVGKLAGAALFNAALTWLTDGAYALAEAALPRLAEVVAEAAAHIGTLVAALEQALPALVRSLAHLGGAATSALGRQLGAIVRTLADLLERLLGLATRADKDGAGEGAAGDGARGARGGHDTRDHGPRTSLQRRLDEAMATALLVLSPLDGRRMSGSVLTTMLWPIRIQFGLQELKPVRAGKVWGIYGRVNPEQEEKTGVLIGSDPDRANKGVSDIEQAVEHWSEHFRRISTPNNNADDAYEISHTGPTNIEVVVGDTKIMVDGIRASDGYLLDAKHVSNIDRSPFIKDSKMPDFIRQKIVHKLEGEFQRYGEVINNPSTPVVGLEVITNEARATPFFQDLLDKYDVPGHIVVKQ